MNMIRIVCHFVVDSCDCDDMNPCEVHLCFKFRLTQGAQVLTVASRVPPADATILLDDWQHGQDQMLFGMTVKFTFWSILPWHLCAIAHYNVAMAREAGRRCLALFDHRIVAHDILDHHLTKRFLDPAFGELGDGIALRPQLEQFVHGMDIGCEEQVASVCT
jgi:hypothetical protein